MSPPRLLILSPHSDDSAFSIGGILAAKTAFHGWSIHQLTVFVGSIHAPYAPQHTTEEAITALRCREDDAFCMFHGIQLDRLEFKETLLRGYPSIPAIFAVNEPQDDPIYGAVCEAVQEAVSGFDLVLAPLGIGGHIEHIMVREACRQLCSHALFYEDLPYAGDYSNLQLDAFVASVLPGAQCRTFDINQGLGIKVERLLGYASQVTARDLDKVIGYSFVRRSAADVACKPGGQTGTSFGPVELLWGRADVLARIDHEGRI
ncbi:LmbE family N-acetylglucosaminyl deacetylase [Agrobacterium vitis]|nr:LmbE family N-acetylglucosaminyl deacetylase [Agrobacterium vitis]MBE1436634.1 LmbE family N-acetylglucosaminyl deacetylase [Agrobacterium vitis]